MIVTYRENHTHTHDRDKCVTDIPAQLSPTVTTTATELTTFTRGILYYSPTIVSRNNIYRKQCFLIKKISNTEIIGLASFLRARSHAPRLHTPSEEVRQSGSR